MGTGTVEPNWTARPEIDRSSVQFIVRPNSGTIDFAGALIARGAGAPLAFAANVIIARMLGAEGFGLYMTLLSGALLAASVAAYGVGPLLTREIAGCPIGSYGEMTSKIGKWALRLTGVLTVLAIFLLVLWLDIGPGAPSSSWAEQVATVVVVPVSVWIVMVVGVLNGMSLVAKGTTVGNVWKNGFLLFGAVLLLILGANKVLYVLWLQAVSIAVAVAAGYYWIRKSVQMESGRAVGAEATMIGEDGAGLERRWLRSAGHFFAISGAVLLLGKADVIIVNGLAGPGQAGLFGAAMRIAQVASMVGLVWISWIQPRVRRQYQSGHGSLVMNTLRQGLMGAFGMTAATAVIAWFLAPWLMGMMGNEFSGAVAPFRWLLVGILIWSICIPLYALLAMTGMEAILSKIQWAQTLLTLAAALPLARAFGALGGAWAWTGGMVFSCLCVIVVGYTYWTRSMLVVKEKEY